VGEKVWLATDFFNGFNGWVFGGGKKFGWQRIFLTDLTDGFWVEKKANQPRSPSKNPIIHC
jgi:hypothetical protein